MRKALSVVAFVSFALACSAQQPPAGGEVTVPDRFGVAHKGKAFPQATPKEALASVIEAIAQGRADYLVAHLMDPAFVDARVADRARLLEPAVEVDLVRLRDAQRASGGGIPDSQRVPDDSTGLNAMVLRTASARAGQQVIADVQTHVTADPEALRELRRFLREGMFTDTDATSKVTLPDVKDRAVFLKKVGDRWFMENRQVEEKAPAPAPAP